MRFIYGLSWCRWPWSNKNDFQASTYLLTTKVSFCGRDGMLWNWSPGQYLFDAIPWSGKHLTFQHPLDPPRMSHLLLTSRCSVLFHRKSKPVHPERGSRQNIVWRGELVRSNDIGTFCCVCYALLSQGVSAIKTTKKWQLYWGFTLNSPPTIRPKSIYPWQFAPDAIRFWSIRPRAVHPCVKSEATIRPRAIRPPGCIK